jgi:mono/diheme cytochrome c family protein
MRVRLANVVLTLGALAGGGIAVGIVVLYAGFYNVAATHQHLAPTYWLLQIGLRESIERHARRVEVPPSTDSALLERGRTLYAAHCVQCHGAPGVAPRPFALGLTPLPKNLAPIARERSTSELYWVIKNGIKMTGMPAWEFRMPNDDLWAVVAFLKKLPLLSPRAYQGLDAPPPLPRVPDADGEADPRRGKRALEQYGCVGCHQIPGLVGPEARLGPTLHGIGSRTTLGGVLPNSPEAMALWLRSPQAFSPHSAMPTLGVTARDARDMAAYLAKLK